MSGVGRMGDLSRTSRIGNVGNLGHVNTGHTVANTGHVDNVARKTSNERTSTGTQTSDARKNTFEKPTGVNYPTDKPALGKTGDSPSDAKLTNNNTPNPGKDTVAKSNRDDSGKSSLPHTTDDTSRLDDPIHHPDPWTPVPRDYTPIAGDSEIVEVNCCYVAKTTFKNQTFVGCQPRTSKKHPGLCAAATCKLYVNGVPQDDSFQHEYKSGETYYCEG
jgi:hypothetical protein